MLLGVVGNIFHVEVLRRHLLNFQTESSIGLRSEINNVLRMNYIVRSKLIDLEFLINQRLVKVLHFGQASQLLLLSKGQCFKNMYLLY